MHHGGYVHPCFLGTHDQTWTPRPPGPLRQAAICEHEALHAWHMKLEAVKGGLEWLPCGNQTRQWDTSYQWTCMMENISQWAFFRSRVKIPKVITHQTVMADDGWDNMGQG